MKCTIKQSARVSMLLCLTTSILFSCKKETAEAPLQPLIEEAVNIKSTPRAAESPAAGETLEETNISLFPGTTSESAGTTAIGTAGIVDFNDEMALTIIPDNAASTFATAPFYIQQVGSAWIHVKENNSGNYKEAFKSDYGHYHLSYETFVPCIRDNGKFGKPVSGGCASINPIKEARKLDTHDGHQWIKIYAYDYNSPSRVFDLQGIKVTKGPIQLWFKKSNGDWLHWSSIGVGTWNLSPYANSIKEVLIASTGNNGPVGFDNVKVSVPAF